MSRVAAVVSARLALRRVQISPLGVNRRASSRPPRIGRIIPLLAGIALLAYFDSAGKPDAVGGQLLELLVGFVLLIVGLVLAGPWFTTAGSRLMVKRANRPATLIAGRRLLDNPKAAFRFISGLVIALFVASALVGALSSITADASSSGGGSAGQATLAEVFCSFSTSNCPASAQVPSVSPRCLTELRAVPGVRAVTVVHRDPVPSAAGELVRARRVRPVVADARHWQVRSGSDSGAYRLLPFEPPWAQITRVVDSLAVGPLVSGGRGETPRRRGRGGHQRVRRARSSEHGPRSNGSFPFRERLSQSTRSIRRRRASLTTIQDMTDVVIVASLIIAACSLAVSIAAGLGERKRPFSLLRLTGVPTSLLHRVVALESALPLLLVSAVSIWSDSCRPPSICTPRSASGSASGSRVLGDRDRWARGFAGDHRLNVPAPEPDHGTRGGPKRMKPPVPAQRLYVDYGKLSVAAREAR